MERRVVQLPGEYSKPLAKLDRKYHGTVVEQVGPLERRLQLYCRLKCLVMITFHQEGSKDMHALLKSLPDCKLIAVGLAMGRERTGTERERSICLSQLRGELSTVGAKAQSSCLLARVGEGHRAAAKRKEWVKREDERREEAMKVHWNANVNKKRIVKTNYLENAELLSKLFIFQIEWISTKSPKLKAQE